MAAVTDISHKLSDAAQHERAPLTDDLVMYMNNLDPPPTDEEVRKVARKIDMRLPPFLFILYVFTWLDRGALGTISQTTKEVQAIADNHRQRRPHGYPRRSRILELRLRSCCWHV